MNARVALTLATIGAILAFAVVVFGAFVRLSNAGLSCPDWPTCYGEVTWPHHAGEVARADEAFPERPFESHKAWREQVHRMLAGSLGTLVLVLAITAAWRRRAAVAAIVVAAIAAALGIAAYMSGWFATAAGLSALAIAIPLVVAARIGEGPVPRTAIVVLSVIVFQAMLGMWTVTWLLKPIVVMGHLLGGLTTFALLAFVALRLGHWAAPLAGLRTVRPWLLAALAVLAIQIALGGWTSANYAALICGFDFPSCLGHWWPPVDFHQAFILWRGIGVDYEGGVLDGPARAAIQETHRIGALVTFLVVAAAAIRSWRAGARAGAAALAVLLVAQVSLGIGNVKLGLPLPVATAHNGVAALLLAALVYLLVRSRAVCRPFPDSIP